MYKVNRLDLGAWEGNLIFRGMLAWAFQEGVGGGTFIPISKCMFFTSGKCGGNMHVVVSYSFAIL